MSVYRTIGPLVLKYVPPHGPSKSFIQNTDMVDLHNICKWEAGSRGGDILHMSHMQSMLCLTELTMPFSKKFICLI